MSSKITPNQDRLFRHVLFEKEIKAKLSMCRKCKKRTAKAMFEPIYKQNYDTEKSMMPEVLLRLYVQCTNKDCNFTYKVE